MGARVSDENRQKRINEIVNRMRFAGLTYLMDNDYGKLTQEEIDIESRKLAIEMKTWASRLVSEAFNEQKIFEVANGRRNPMG